MSDTLPEILVVDVEATCWRGPTPPGEMNEIIEIGACLLDPGTGERSGRRSILVRPRRSSVSPFCTELTSLTQELVNGGLDFADACAALREKCQSPRRIWASFGAYDRNQFLSQCAAFDVPYPFTDAHINVKASFAAVAELSRPLGMAGVLKRLGLPLEGTHHRGGDDAWNIAAILRHLVVERRISIDRLVLKSSSG